MAAMQLDYKLATALAGDHASCRLQIQFTTLLKDGAVPHLPYLGRTSRQLDCKLAPVKADIKAMVTKLSAFA